MTVYRALTPGDVPRLLPLYLDYYNRVGGSAWTEETAGRRIRQVVTMQDAFGLLAEEDGAVLGFVMGYFQQYDDGVSYRLEEIVVAAGRQGRGEGTALMRETERQAKARGAFLVELLAVNDAPHERFYGRLGYHTAANFLPKCKLL